MKNTPIKVSIIGLDTSHSVALPKLMQDPETPLVHRVPELLATRCLRFETPFQNAQGLDERQKVLESIGVEVTEDFEYAVGDCDAIMIEINDPERHLEYFEKCANLNKPIFLDKPLAGNLADSKKILQIAKEKNVHFFTASSLRFDMDFAAGLAQIPQIASCHIWAPIGKAPSGSSIIWYGVHAFEMLERALGIGAETLQVAEAVNGLSALVSYSDGRRGVVELTNEVYHYGALLRDGVNENVLVNCTGEVPFYCMLLQEIVKFFRGESNAVAHEESLEIMALLEACELSYQQGGSIVKVRES